MADDLTLNAGSGGATLAADDISNVYHQRVKVQYGTNGSATDVSDSNPLPVDDAGGSLTVDNAQLSVVGSGTEAAAMRVTIATDSTGLLSVDDNGGSLTVDNAQLSVVGAGTEAAAMRVTIANDSTGLLSVDDNGGSLTVDSGAAFTVQEDGAALTALQLIDNSIFADDAAFTLTSSSVTMSGAIRDDALGALSAVESDAVPLRVDANGALWTIPSGTVTVDGSGVTQPVSGTVTANLSATDNAVLDQIEVNTSYGDNTGSGTESGALRVTLATDSTGLISVDDNGSSLTIDNADITTIAGAVSAGQMQVDVVAELPAGTQAIGKLAANDGVDIGDVSVNNTVTVDLGSNNDVQGDVANDAADSGNPVKIGAHATSSVEAETQVANSDRVDIKADLNGVMLSRPHTTLEEVLSEHVTNTSGTSTDFTTFVAGGAGIHNYVTTLTVYNSSATDGYVDIRNGSAGSVIFTAPAPATGGSVINFPVPLKGAEDTALAFDVSGALSTVHISVVGFQAQG